MLWLGKFHHTYMLNIKLNYVILRLHSFKYVDLAPATAFSCTKITFWGFLLLFSFLISDIVHLKSNIIIWVKILNLEFEKDSTLALKMGAKTNHPLKCSIWANLWGKIAYNLGISDFTCFKSNTLKMLNNLHVKFENVSSTG